MPAAEHLADITLGEIRAELRSLLALTETGVKPLPDAVLPAGHPFGPGREWRIKYRAHDPYDYNRQWAILTREPDDDDLASCVYIHTPDSMAGDYLATPTSDARQLAMAILAACDRADHQTAGIPNLADRRKTHPKKGEQMT